MYASRIIKTLSVVFLLMLISTAHAEMTCVISGNEWHFPQSDSCESFGDMPFGSATFALKNIALQERDILWSDAQCPLNSSECNLLLEENSQKTLCALVLMNGVVFQQMCATASYNYSHW